MGKIKDIHPITGLDWQWYGYTNPYDNGPECEAEIQCEAKYRRRYAEVIKEIRDKKKGANQ